MASVLVVDDNPIDRQFLVTLVGYAGHRSLEAGDGLEALDIARRELPDLVITDILMPRMDGFELVRQLRETPSTARTPVVFYTANYLERTARSLAQGYGVAQLITKAVEPQVLLRAIAAALATPADPSQLLPHGEMERQHVQLVNDKLAASVKALEAVNARLRAIIDIGRHLASEPHPGVLVEASCVAARQLVGATYTAVAMLEADRHTFGHLAECRVDEEPHGTPRPWVPSVQALGELLGQRDALRLQGEAATTYTRGLIPVELVGGSFLAVPIESPTRRYGWLYFGEKLGLEAFTAEDESLALMIAGQLAVAYENATRYELIQESEERWRNLVEFSPEAILVHDSERLIYANPAAARLFAAAKAESMVGQRVNNFIGLGERPPQEDQDQALHEARTTELLAQKLVRLDGRVVDMEGVAAPIRYGGQTRHLVILNDVTERKRAEELLVQKEREVAALQERNRLAGDIHDTLAQNFIGIRFQLQSVRDEVDSKSGRLAHALQMAENLAGDGIRQARDLVWRLVPIELDGPLASVLGREVERYSVLGQWRASLTISGRQRDLDHRVQTALLRVCQEALANVNKHASAKAVQVRLTFASDQVSLAIRDDGVGFDTATGGSRVGSGFGLRGMAERSLQAGGRLTVQSKPGRGCLVRVVIPLGDREPVPTTGTLAASS